MGFVTSSGLHRHPNMRHTFTQIPHILANKIVKINLFLKLRFVIVGDTWEPWFRSEDNFWELVLFCTIVDSGMELRSVLEAVPMESTCWS